jgi:hypothetical protein
MLRSAETLIAHADRQGQHDPTSGKFNSQNINPLDIAESNAAPRGSKLSKLWQIFDIPRYPFETRRAHSKQAAPASGASISKQVALLHLDAFSHPRTGCA